MKRVLALGAATVCTLGAIGGAFATGEPTKIEALYNVDESYTITFPMGIEFDGYNNNQTVTVKADEILINDGSKLKITMVSANGALAHGENSTIAYTMKIGENEPEDIVADTPFDILTVESGDRDGAAVTLTFTSGDDSNVTLAGKHSDILTFKVDVEKPAAPVFATAEIAGKTWMTENLKIVPEGATWEDDGIYVAESGEVYYNWEAAKKACPEGWELPSKEDLESLVALYDKDTIMSGPFKGVRAGLIDNGALDYAGTVGRYWSATEDGDSNPYYLRFTGSSMGVSNINDKPYGYSVRCVAE